jgi:hypothetical protein
MVDNSGAHKTRGIHSMVCPANVAALRAGSPSDARPVAFEVSVNLLDRIGGCSARVGVALEVSFGATPDYRDI